MADLVGTQRLRLFRLEAEVHVLGHPFLLLLEVLVLFDVAIDQLGDFRGIDFPVFAVTDLQEKKGFKVKISYYLLDKWRMRLSSNKNLDPDPGQILT